MLDSDFERQVKFDARKKDLNTDQEFFGENLTTSLLLQEFKAKNKLLSEIPDTILMSGWKEVEILPSDQILINLNEFEEKYPIKISPQYYLQKIKGTSSEIFLREEVAMRLLTATNLLPRGYSFILFDGYRSLEVQSSLFNMFKEQLKNQNPNSTEKEIIEMTQIYVSLPSANHLKPSPHATGGAIDLSIIDQNENLLDMGTKFDSLEIQAQTAYFKYRSEGEKFHLNRRLLYSIMTSNGFTNYPEEWWHYDFGNQFWGHVLQKQAIYSLARGGV